MPPLRDTTPTVRPGLGSLNHRRAASARPPIIPTTALPGLRTPSVLGPTKHAPWSFATAAICIVSHKGTRSGTSTNNVMPASIASIVASLTSGAGTKITEISTAPTSAIASATESNTGAPWTSCPPLPGVQPATMFVPNSRMSLVRARPSRPVMPCTRMRLVWSMMMDIWSKKSAEQAPRLNGSS